MELCQERRGQYLGMEYMEETRALLKYELPLNEIIYDFFDALKSRSKGYASFDYELKGYEQSELVKLDILINREEVDALSFIVHKDSAYERGRKMCEKLKDEIPRHLFEIPIQAHRALEDARATHILYEKLLELYGTGPDRAKAFEPVPLICKVKRESPATKAQKERLKKLISMHQLVPEYDVEMLTKNEASRQIDRILAAYGSLQK